MTVWAGRRDRAQANVRATRRTCPTSSNSDGLPIALSSEWAIHHSGFRSAFEIAREALPAMREARFGRLIAIGSVQQIRPNAQLTVYAAMKAALSNLMRNLAKSSGPVGITCNAILPGLIATDRSAEVQADPVAYEALLSRIPCRREGDPREVAALALYLAGPMGGYATGGEYLVDGGLALP